MLRQKCACFLSILLITQAGCATPPDKVIGPAPAELVSAAKTIAVVAMEPPRISGSLIPERSNPFEGAPWPLAPFIAAKAIYEEAEVNRAVEAAHKVTSTLAPTLIMAHHAAHRISSDGFHKALVQEGVKSLVFLPGGGNRPAIGVPHGQVTVVRRSGFPLRLQEPDWTWV